MTKLKLCRHWFCGKKPKIKIGHPKIIKRFLVECDGCGHYFAEFGMTKTEAVQKWNKRMSI